MSQAWSQVSGVLDSAVRELDELDRDIARGVNALDEMEETERLRIARTLKKRIDSHA